MTILIIGATSYIGNQIYKFAKKNDISVIGTRCHSEGEEYIRFDLLQDSIVNIDNLICDKEKYVLLCAADANIQYCFQNRQEAYKKNVTATIQLINQLNKLGYYIIFLSTDNVFDGEKGKYMENDIPNPMNEYGKMKVEVEQYLLNNIPSSCVMRIGKTVGDFTQKKDLLIEWYKMAKERKTISCIKNNILTLTCVDDIVQCFFIIVKRKMSGIYHIVSDESFSRKELCEQFLSHLKLETDIVEKDISEFHFIENRPLNISMRNKKFKQETGYKFYSLTDIWNKFYKEYFVKGI